MTAVHSSGRMRFQIEHRTEYQYSDAVHLDPHVLRLTPRPSPNKTVIRRELLITPEPQGIARVLDAEGNSTETVWFGGRTDRLSILMCCEVETRRINPFDYLITTACRGLPVMLDPVETVAMRPYLLREQPERLVTEYALELLAASNGRTLDFLNRLNENLNTRFTQEVREEGQPMTPVQTLLAQSGACRDLTVLFMDACRSVGLPARFVSGYQEGDVDMEHRHLHAWAEVYLPGAGWRGYDPTLNLAVADGHIALAASHTPLGAAPVLGSFWGRQVTSILTHRLELSAG